MATGESDMTKHRRCFIVIRIAIFAVLVAVLCSTDGTQNRTPELQKTATVPHDDFADDAPLASVPANDLLAIERVESELQVRGKLLYARQRGGMRDYYYMEVLDGNDIGI